MDAQPPIISVLSRYSRSADTIAGFAAGFIAGIGAICVLFGLVVEPLEWAQILAGPLAAVFAAWIALRAIRHEEALHRERLETEKRRRRSELNAGAAEEAYQLAANLTHVAKAALLTVMQHTDAEQIAELGDISLRHEFARYSEYFDPGELDAFSIWSTSKGDEAINAIDKLSISSIEDIVRSGWAYPPGPPGAAKLITVRLPSHLALVKQNVAAIKRRDRGKHDRNYPVGPRLIAISVAASCNTLADACTNLIEYLSQDGTEAFPLSNHYRSMLRDLATAKEALDVLI